MIISNSLWYDNIPPALQSSAEKILAFLIHSQNKSPEAAQAQICAMENRAWLIELHNKIVASVLLSDKAPFDRMLHDASISCVSSNDLTLEAAEIRIRRPWVGV